MGNVYNFILTWWLTKSLSGQLALRIDDADILRTKNSYIVNIFSVLDFIDMKCDIGPTSINHFMTDFSQQDKKNITLIILKIEMIFFTVTVIANK